MIQEVFEFLFFALYLGLGYFIPIIMASQAFISKEKEKTKMKRWLIHFILINVSRYTVFPIFSFIGLQTLNYTLGVCILILPMYISFDTLENLIENNYNNIFASKIDNLRQLTQVGLQKLNLL